MARACDWQTLEPTAISRARLQTARLAVVLDLGEASTEGRGSFIAREVIHTAQAGEIRDHQDTEPQEEDWVRWSVQIQENAHTGHRGMSQLRCI